MSNGGTDRGTGTGGALLYERAGVNGVCPSSFCWRVRIALAMKGVPHTLKQLHFGEVETLQAETGSKTVPVLSIGDKTIIGSDEIAAELDARSPSNRLRDPSSDALLVGALGDLSNRIAPLIAPDYMAKLDPVDRAYYQASLEAKLKRDLAELDATRDVLELDLAFSIGRLEKDLGGRNTFGSDGPNWADVVIYSQLLRISFASPRSWPELPDVLQVWWEGRDQAWRRICLAPA